MDNRVKYHCIYCDYRFSRTGKVSVAVCPYCGKSNSIELDKKDKASRLLEEAGSYKK